MAAYKVNLALFPETPGELLALAFKFFTKCSEKKRAKDLQILVGREIDPESVRSWQWRTNCAITLVGILYFTDCPHPAVRDRSQIGLSPDDLNRVGNDYKAWYLPDFKNKPELPIGTIVWYQSTPSNFHFAMVTGPANDNGEQEMTEGGGADNSINTSVRNPYVSHGRPAIKLMDPNKLRLGYFYKEEHEAEHWTYVVKNPVSADELDLVERLHNSVISFSPAEGDYAGRANWQGPIAVIGGSAALMAFLSAFLEMCK
ncbi:MAG: hypothetical protein ACEQSB_06250 [Undibacterium sp.]